ncbi:hypothetical protein L596_020541 [Steinernema carpocapsae]|uniref:7TM GPCR serpentine receptor class x (Srx) domain-containing protein n=1 Tax=Steinernema carpocapsae TaxID=34508 RepID=A0A4U5MUL6_STECR|nr:hypothetical protein L596_020541 [Steinernema carpocapsae]
MELLLFRRSEFDRLYNCSYFTEKEWNSFGKPDISFGVLTIVLGIVLTIPTIPCLIVIIKSKLIEHTAYKLMFYVGLNDVSCLLFNSVASGYYSIKGDVACVNLILKYVLGRLGESAWLSQSITVVLLAMTRWIDIWKPRYIKNLLSGKRCYGWIGATLLYSVYFMFFGKGAMFSSNGYAWYFDPYYGIDKVNFVSRDLITIQTFFICLFTFSGAFIYGYMQIVAIPVRVGQAATIFWILSSGGPGLMHIIVNKTIRNGDKNLCLKRSVKVYTTDETQHRTALVSHR